MTKEPEKIRSIDAEYLSGKRFSYQEDIGEIEDVDLLAARLDPVVAGRRVANYLRVLTLEAQTLARACGKTHVHNLEPEDLVALTVEAAAMARVPLAGTSWIPGT